MLRLTEQLFVVLCFTQFLLGLLANGFIWWVKGRSWLASRGGSVSDFLIASLGLSRIVLLGVLQVDGAFLTFSPKEHESGTVMKVIDLVWTFANQLNVWLATCLGVFYCLKIASFSHRTFLWLKWRVSRVVVYMLLGALLLSCSSTVSLIREFKVHSAYSGINDTGDTVEYVRKRSLYKMVHVVGTLWYLPPLLVALAAYVLLILSLGRHSRHMQQRGAGSRDPSAEAHRRAIRIIFSFFVLFLFYFLAFLIASSSYFFPETKVVLMTGETITMLYLTGHSFILILGNVRLRQAFVRLLGCETRCLKPAPRTSVPP
ncbi:PREDICTED: taste receptor type 2 member 3-like [Elephantulus edwardii]|uniref:taste receptor type 2 member 3-like n=1 Tax=Elephantulus edwardii TaxID=28737 RepID=UPI0003F07192|nr:PREDICTED: taste receptor type 2 member 3-like [Elephantulus edwardii]